MKNALHVHHSNNKTNSATNAVVQDIFAKKYRTVAAVVRTVPKPVGRNVQASLCFCDPLQHWENDTSASTPNKPTTHKKAQRSSKAKAPSRPPRNERPR